ncbi:MAG: hypothetical protein ACI9LN_001658, partial [Saprospiraceae bacterium]
EVAVKKNVFNDRVQRQSGVKSVEDKLCE